MPQLLAEMSHFEQILNKLLAKMSDFDKDCAITCGNVGILIKIAHN
jgi:hypothetical protein